MSFTIALAQCGYPEDGDVAAQVELWCARAEDEGASLLVFPEDLMSPRELTPTEIRQLAQPLYGQFLANVLRSAWRHQLWVAFTMYEANGDDAPYNTAVLVDDTAMVRGTYRKCHLYEAHGVSELERNAAGDKLCDPIETPFGLISLGICYDLRFPEVARHSALRGCDLMLYPSAWHDGPNKLAHWRTLLSARAIENEIFVAGTCRAGRRYVGHSLVCNPLGQVLAESGSKADNLVVCDIDLAKIDEVRSKMPLLDQRRPNLY